MGKQGPKPTGIDLLQVYEHLWYFVFKGLRDGAPSVALLRPRITERKLSTHPVLRQELRNERHFNFKMVPAYTKGVPAERELWARLLEAKKPSEVRSICRRPRYWLNPKWGGRPYVQALHDHAAEFLKAKNGSRFPCSSRPSSDEKRLDYLARAMAGISCGVSGRTAVNLLAGIKHTKECPCWRCSNKRLQEAIEKLRL